MRIFIVRHAESYSNLSGRMMSTTDWDLTDKGILQCAVAHEQIKDLLGPDKFNRVFSSTLKRVKQTAELVSGGFSGITHTPLLNEMDLGKLEGLTWDERIALFPDIDSELALSGTVFPGGESFSQVESRCKQFIGEYIKGLHNDATVLIVSHGITIRILVNVFTGRPVEHVNFINWPDNTAITELEYDMTTEIARVIRLNDYTHLTESELNSPGYDKWGLFSRIDY